MQDGESEAVVLAYEIDDGFGGTDTSTVTIDVQGISANPLVEINPILPDPPVEGPEVTIGIEVSFAPGSDGTALRDLNVGAGPGLDAELESGDDGDAVLEPGETWVYALVYPLGAKAGGILTVDIVAEDDDGEAFAASFLVDINSLTSSALPISGATLCIVMLLAGLLLARRRTV